jgi:hypothetical protein
MTPEQKAAYVFAQASCALIEALGMVATNQERERHGFALAYGEEAFAQLLKTYGIDQNSTLSLFHGVPVGPR